MIRQIVLDTETTGMNRVGVRHEGHCIIEIGAVEVVNRRLTGRRLHHYIRPDRPIDPASTAVHGITDAFLIDKPRFADIATELLDFIQGAQLVIHNAAFDVGFIEYEYQKLGGALVKIEQLCSVVDTLAIARQLFPGKRNSLDALCQRYQIDNRRRTLHGALLDAEILAELYLVMTGGQTCLHFITEQEQLSDQENSSSLIRPLNEKQTGLRVVYASEHEVLAHNTRLALVEQKGGSCLWLKL